MAYIKFKNDLPEWFNINKYIEMHLSVRNILPNLLYRKVLIDLLRNRLTIEVVPKEAVYSQDFIFELKGNLKLNNNKFSDDAITIRKKIIIYMLDNLKQHPLFPYKDHENGENPLYKVVDMCFGMLMSGYLEYTGTKVIQELSPVDLSRNYFGLSEPYRAFIKSEICAFGNTRNNDNEEELLIFDNHRFNLTKEIVDDCRDSLFTYNIKKMKNSKLSKHPIIEVNLNFTNSFLMRQFEEWLNKKRIQISNNNIEYEEDLLDADPYTLVSKINEYRIFAYLDLSLWQKIENHKIKKSVCAIAIFPNGEKGESIFKNLEENFLPPLLNGYSSKEMRRLVALYNLERIDSQ